MFKKRHLSRGIHEEIPLNIQAMLWDILDKRIASGAKMDYLQIFDLIAKGDEEYPIQYVLHRQEVPEHRKEWTAECKKPVTAKIYIIDDGTHCTMLFPEER